MRLGALLALDALRGSFVTLPNRLLLWQPVGSGRQYLQQLLRLRIAAGFSSEETERESTSEMRARWDAGESLEIAGYEVTGELAEAVDGLTLVSLAASSSLPIDWFEISQSNPEPSATTARTVAAAQAAGATVELTVLSGEPFWALQEITVVPELLAATCALWDDHGRS
jgi:exosortase A-associated hydrolase 2